MEALPGATDPYRLTLCRVLETHPGMEGDHLRAVEAHSGAFKANPGEFTLIFRVTKIHHGAMEAHPAAFKTYLLP
jgi:hypothetical protein